MKQKLFLVAVVALLIIFIYSEIYATSFSKQLVGKQATVLNYKNIELTEEFSFLIQDFKINHQSEMNNLNIKVRFRYESGISDTQYPDFRAIAKDIEYFLSNYPNKVDYWEILNKKLTKMVLKKYPMLETITSEIRVSPSQKVSYIRSSIVSYSLPKKNTKKLKTTIQKVNY